jgi:hypothetical protein
VDVTVVLRLGMVWKVLVCSKTGIPKYVIGEAILRTGEAVLWTWDAVPRVFESVPQSGKEEGVMPVA